MQPTPMVFVLDSVVLGQQPFTLPVPPSTTPPPPSAARASRTRTRKGWGALLDCLRIRPRHRSPSPANPIVVSPPPAAPLPLASPGLVLSRFIAGRLSGPTVDSLALVDQRGAWLMQLDALEELNAKAEACLANLFESVEDSVPDRQAEAEALLQEVERRRRDILALRINLHIVEVALQQRGIPLDRPLAETGLVEVPEDAGLCEFCVSVPANAEFDCCHYRGGCVQCSETVLRSSGRCPHCRAPCPELRVLPGSPTAPEPAPVPSAAPR
eukprot:EG_transcript_7674